MEPTSWRERWGERLADYPLLRTLWFNPWFALTFFVVTLAGLGAVVCLPKIWVSTPPDFKPVMRVSILDLIQARALRAAADRHAAAGRHREAALAWQGAVLNDPGNLDLHRALFRHLARAPLLPINQVSRSLFRINWLLQLGGTNQVDLQLAAETLDRYGLAEDVFTLLAPQADHLPLTLEPAYLKALFQVGRYEEFGRRWGQVQSTAINDPELVLCRAAYLAGWGPPEVAATHRRIVQDALDDPVRGTYACRLEMAVASRRLDVAGYRAALQRLEARAEDRATDHARFWRLLLAAGLAEEGRNRAHSYNRPPETAYEVVQMADALQALGLQDELVTFLQRHVLEFGYSPSVWSVAVWATYTDVLVAARQWEQLKEAARQMRLSSANQAVLSGFSHFLEGWVAHVQGSREAARDLFQEAIRLGFPVGRVGLQVATQLNQLGYPDLALETLRPLETRFGDLVEYWRAVFRASFALRADDTLLLRAALRAHELAPESLEWKFNYAAALLISRRRPEQALSLTFELLSRGDFGVGGRINHAIALALNRRFDEAADILRNLESEPLNAIQREAWLMGWLEIYHQRRDWAGVRECLAQLESVPLFPSQQRWLENIRRDLPDPNPAPQAAATNP